MKLEEVLKAVRDFSKQNLTGAPLEYLLKTRQLSEQTIQQFDLGYFPFREEKTFTDCPIKWLKHHKIGFIDTDKKLRILFEGRILFPVYDIEGNLVAIQSRMLPIVDQQLYAFNPRKYWHNSFDKMNVIYGLYHHKTGIRQSKEVIVTEGQFDLLIGAQFALNNVVACSGTALNIHHMMHLARYAKTVHIIFDSDEGGNKGIARLKKHRFPDLKINYVKLPCPQGGKIDLDLFLRSSGTEALRKLLRTPVGDDLLSTLISAL